MVVATEAGRALTRRVDVARERLGRRALSGWSADEIETFILALRRYADSLARQSPSGARGPIDPR